MEIYPFGLQSILLGIFVVHHHILTRRKCTRLTLFSITLFQSCEFHSERQYNIEIVQFSSGATKVICLSGLSDFGFSGKVRIVHVPNSMLLVLDVFVGYMVCNPPDAVSQTGVNETNYNNVHFLAPSNFDCEQSGS